MRTRDLRPGVFENELLGTADDFISLLFLGLTVLADPRGVLEDRPLKIKAKLFPYKDRDVDSGLDELARLGFIERYSADGTPLLFICKFAEHQRPHPKERNNSFPLPSRGSAVEKHGSAVNRFEPCTYKKIPKYNNDVHELSTSKGTKKGSGSTRKPKQDTRRYAEPDGRGNPRSPEPDFPNVFLSDAERHRARERFNERGLKPEFHSDTFQLLNTSLSRLNNLRDSVEHYTSLTGWALREALKNQADAERTAKVCAPAKETPQDETIRRIREYGRRAGSNGNSGNHSFDVPGIPALGASNSAMVPNAPEDSSRRHPVGFGPFHQDEHRPARADHQPAFCFTSGNEPGADCEIRTAPRAAECGAACDAGEALRAVCEGTGEALSARRAIARETYERTSGKAAARRSYR